jgi:hypothetical protein
LILPSTGRRTVRKSDVVGVVSVSAVGSTLEFRTEFYSGPLTTGAVVVFSGCGSRDGE